MQNSWVNQSCHKNRHVYYYTIYLLTKLKKNFKYIVIDIFLTEQAISLFTLSSVWKKIDIGLSSFIHISIFIVIRPIFDNIQFLSWPIANSSNST